jgi:iron complex transport system permease protein
MLLQFMARLKGSGVEMLVLFGIALVFTCNALVALLQLVATEDILQQIEFWSLGSVARANWQKIGILAAVMACAAAVLARGGQAHDGASAGGGACSQFRHQCATAVAGAD